MKKKKMSKKKKIILISILLIILIAASVLTYFFYFKKESPIPDPIKVEVLDKIKGYEYNLEDRDTPLYKEKFLKLKEILESDMADYDEYAKYLAQLFVIDLYTIDNKISKYDVGSLDFIYPEEQEKFQNKVLDTMYKLVEDNTTGTRKQELPIVSNIELGELKTTEYKKKEQKLKAYEVEANITYEKDLGYDKKVAITMVEEENKIYVVQIKAIEK